MNKIDKKFDLMDRPTAIVSSIVLFVMFLTKYRLDLEYTDHLLPWVAGGVIFLNVIQTGLRLYSVKQSKLEKLEELTFGKLSPADEREESVKNQAGHTAFLSIMTLNGTAMFIFATLSILQLMSPWSVFISLFFQIIGGFIYYRSLIVNGFEVQQKIIDREKGKK